MSLHWTCDYCGQPIDADELFVAIDAKGATPTSERPGWRRVDQQVGHFHSMPQRHDEPSCYRRVLAALELAMSWGPTLETIETATPQWVGAQRRRHHREDDLKEGQ